MAALFGLPVHAKDVPRGIDTPGCKDVIARLVSETGVRFDHVSPSGDNVFLRHQVAKELSLNCAAYMRLSVFASWDGAFPSSAYFDFLARTGTIVTRERKATLVGAIRRCYLAALKSKDEQDELHLPHAEIDCQAFLRDGGGTAITVSGGRDDPVNK